VNEMKQNINGTRRAVMVHDGTKWRLYVPQDASHNSQVHELSACEGPAAKLPQALLERAVEAGVRSVRFLVAGELARLDGLVVDGLPFARAVEAMKSGIAEATGAEAEGILPVGRSYSWQGVRKPFSLVAKFEVDAVEDFKAALDGFGLGCDGFGSLEIALLAVWQSRSDARAAFAAVGAASALLVPAARGANPGPQTAPCGERHFAIDAGNWTSRLRRLVAPTSGAFHLLADAGCLGAMTEALREAGYTEIVGEDLEAWLCNAAALALRGRANKVKSVALPIVNPYEPRKRFSNGWIVAASLFVLALPAAYLGSCSLVASSCHSRSVAECARYLPLEERVKKARKSLDSAQREYASVSAASNGRIKSRRPLRAFIDISYFFCKYSGRTVVLESIVQKGDKIAVEGLYVDPEDGVALNNSLIEYAKSRGIEIVENNSRRDGSGESDFLYRFKYAFDCSKVDGSVR